MAKTKTTKKAASKKKATTPTSFIRKGALAYIGLYGAAYERAKMRTAQLRNLTDGMFDELVEKGQDIETKAVVLAKGAQVKVQETAQETVSKVRGALPKASNDRVEELEAELAKMNKKVVALSKKAAKPAKKKVMKTEKTVKKAVNTAAKTVAEKTETPKAA